MSRKIVPVIVLLAVVGAFSGTLFFLYKKAQPAPVVHETTTAVVTDIVKKAIAPGAIVPRREVAIKPRVSGVVQKLYVEPGQLVKAKALVARIQIVPNMVALNQAESKLNEVKINFKNAQKELDRFRQLLAAKVINQTDFNQHELNYELRKQELDAAESNLQLVREGVSRHSGKVANLVHSTVDGMVLDVPVKEGGSVIEANTFNEGTTIASIADMGDLVFVGRVDESEVGRLKEGMPVSISVGALGSEALAGKLEYIAPKGREKDGTIEFEVRASVELKAGLVLRANYSANADIILERRDHVLAINEGLVSYEGGRAFVEVQTAPSQFRKSEVKVGLSDGILVEVLGGIDQSTMIKKPPPETEARKSG